MSTRFLINRVPGDDSGTVKATFTVEFRTDDAEAVERFARVMRELIPEEDRAQFLEDFRAAGAAAGFKVQ